MTIAYHAELSPHTALDHQIRRREADEIQDEVCFLEHCIARHLGCAHLLCGVDLEAALLHDDIGEFLEHVVDDKHVDYSLWDNYAVLFSDSRIITNQ